MRKQKMEKDVQGSLLDIYAGFYDVAMGATNWQEVLAPVMPLFSGRCIHLFVLNRETNSIDNLALVGNFSQESIDNYNNYYSKIDERARYMACQEVGGILPCREVWGAEYVRCSEFYQDHLIPNDLRYLVATKPAQFGEVSALAAFMRSEQTGDYSEKELSLFRPLVHQLGRALLIQYKLQGLESSVFACEQALNALSFAVIAVDRSGYIHQANREAESLLSRLSMLHIKNQRLKGQSLAEQSTLDKLLSDAIDLGIGGGAQYSDAATLQRWYVWAVPANETAGLFSQRMAVLAFTCADNPPPAEALIQQVFKLTHAESRLAQALVTGIGANDYAEQNRVSVTTVRTQIRAIFEKTGVNRQSDLIRLLLSSGLINAK